MIQKQSHCQKGKNKSASYSASDEDEYKFQLVQFCQSQNAGLLDIDIVPTSWVSWNKIKKVCIVKYPSQPYTAKVCKQLQRLVQNERSPMDEWSWWDVQLKGGADTYELALVRVGKLQTATYAYTTDNEVNGLAKSQKATEKRMKKSTKELFDTAEIDFVMDDEWTPNSEDPARDDLMNSDESSDESEPAQTTKISGRKKLAVQKSHKNAIVGSNALNINTRTSSVQGASSDENWMISSKAVRLSTANNNLSDGNNNSDPLIEEDKSAKCATAKSTAQIANTADEPEEEFGQSRLSPDTLFLLKVFKRFSFDLQSNTAAINALHDALLDKKMVHPVKITVEQIEKKNELQLPFETHEKFQEFDQKLREDAEVNQTLISSLKQLLDRNNNVTKSVTTILRKFFTRDVVTGFTAKKKVEGKILLKATKFGSCLIAALTDFHTLQDGTPINEDIVLKCAGNAISNAKDWDGGRKVRAEKNI